MQILKYLIITQITLMIATYVCLKNKPFKTLYKILLIFLALNVLANLVMAFSIVTRK